MLNRKFEKFLGGPSDRFNLSDVDRVTLSARGLLYFNAKMYKKMGSPQNVALYYNRDEDVIAVRAVARRPGETFPVIKKQSGWAIHASTFCRHFRIRVDLTQRIIHPEIDNQHNLLLDLRDTVTVGGIKRGKNKLRRPIDF